ncbi:prepilin-type N-terminal cleavage/methylation domain-containing protein [Candidatus Parabeggiatoa sp. HSG14]|uniref:prepilin-type N-terminal cleavage/methylation domain-containing protein n=1 Tax=Candidatus Parabeggiatoa sp. HSG14 TaxID=3055593 RepID=UPI0025A78A64|nr:prepilin-type N-terminal cleavage/methylation domain-containing protein [Thiotrichales bacterium HSG14]
MRRLRGFTLLEVLVVLILVSVISTLLLEGVFHILQLRSRFVTHIYDLQQGAIIEYWFRSSTAAIVTDYREGEHIFKGDEHQFSGLTLAALDVATGVPTNFTWQLQYDGGVTRLRYQNSKDEYWVVAHWLGDEGYFRYMAKDGEWHDKWPPQFGKEPPQIPRLILLQGQRRQTPFTWIVKLAEHNRTRIDYRLEEF